jgi:GDP-mannose 6-dehydrogenase
MRISIFGMGYVGVVSGACLLRDGHTVCGVDPVAAKVKDLAEGRSPLQEPGVAELLASGHRAGRLTATTDPAQGVRNADMVWICVGTPSSLEKGLDLTHVKTVIQEIGEAIRDSQSRPLIVLRSTVLPGTTENVVVPTLEAASGLKVGRDLHVVFHPEFLREATAVADFDNPPKIVVGEASPGAADPLMDLYQGYGAPKFRLAPAEAEMVKYCDNLFHALKVTFANEIGAIAHSAGIDARKVSEVFCADTKLNISPRYLRPGFAYGGSCLPKDLRAILRYATLQSLQVPLLRATLESNKAQIEGFVSRILARKPRTVGMVGLAFKPGTDDMRESPYVTVAKRLIGEGVRVRIYDPGVHVERLIGSNKAAVEAALEHLRDLLVGSLDELDGVDLVLVNHATLDAGRVHGWLAKGSRVMDLAGIGGVDRKTAGYEGIAW